MKIERGRESLTVLWVTGFAGTILGFLYLYWHVGIGPDVRSKLFESIVGQYVPFLGAVLGFHFAVQDKAQPMQRISPVPYYVAMIMSGLWNLLTVGLVVRACFDPDKTQDALDGISGLVPKVSWIVAPAMGFFFGKSPEAGR